MDFKSVGKNQWVYQSVPTSTGGRSFYLAIPSDSITGLRVMTEDFFMTMPVI